MTARGRAWAGAVATMVLSAGLADDRTTDPDALQRAKSSGLRSDPVGDLGRRGRVFGSGSEARRAADERADALPLPAGGNFNGVR